MFYHWNIKELFQTSFSKLRAKMPKDDEDEDKDDNRLHRNKRKRVTFADNEIHHEVDEEFDEEENESEGRHNGPIRRTVPSYVIGHPLADYDATEGSVRIYQQQLLLFLTVIKISS